MTKFGTYSLPHVLSIQRQQARLLHEVLLPGRPFAYRKDRGGYGARFTVSGEIRPTSQLVKDQIAVLADGTVRILDLEATDLTALENCFRWETGPVWTDNTIEAASAGGTPFTLLGAATDYAYFGHREKFNKLQFDLNTFGLYDLPSWEYSKGASSWGSLAGFEALLDHFLGSALDPLLWTVDSGTPSVGSSLLSFPNVTIMHSNASHGPFHQVTARIDPSVLNEKFEFYAMYTDSSHFLCLLFHTDGNLYVQAGNGYSTSAMITSYTTGAADYTIVSSPTWIRVYKDGVRLCNLTDAWIPYIVTIPGPLRFIAYYNPTNFTVDYVKTPSADETKAFSQDGTITLTPPSDWKQDTVNAITNKFWLRVKAASVTTPATVNQIQLNNVFNCIMLDPSFNETVENYNRIPYTATFAQTENP